MTQDKIKALLDKIRKLKNKAEDSATTEAESLAFAAKVAELLAQHGLEEAQLEVKDQEAVEHERELMKSWETSGSRRVLAWAVCRLYMVYAIRHPQQKQWTLVGRKHNIIMVKDMMDYLVKTVLRLGRDYGKERPGADITDFKRGCFMRIAERIEELRMQQIRAAQPAYTAQGNPGNLPALYANELELSKKYYAAHFGGGRLRTSTTRVKQGWDAMAGRAAGDRVSLSRQVGSGRGRTSHLLTNK
jgi:hypothetical protein